jgi:Immunoglobulin domain
MSSTSGVIDSLTLATTGVFNAPPPVSPTITAQPSNKTVTIGGTARFNVKALGTKPLHYQWRKNGTNIVGARKSACTTPPTTMEDNNAQFSVMVSGRAGTVLSTDATLTVSP